MINNLKKFLNEEQDPKAVEKLMAKVNGLLTSGEEVEYVAVQKKPAINLSPDCIALTNKRIIFCKPTNFGFSRLFMERYCRLPYKRRHYGCNILYKNN